MADQEPIRLSTSVLASGDRVTVLAAALHRTDSGPVLAGGRPGERVVKVTPRGRRQGVLCALSAGECARLARVLTAQPARVEMEGDGVWQVVRALDGALVARVLASESEDGRGLTVRWLDRGVVVDVDFPDSASECVALLALRGLALDAESAAVLRGCAS